MSNRIALRPTPTALAWTATERETYRERLEVLPPAGQRRGMFLLGCPIDANGPNGESRYLAYKHSADGYFVGSRPITVDEFRGLQP